MKGLIGDIEDRSEDNRDVRRMHCTGPRVKLVAMSLRPGEEIGEEVHEHTDRLFRTEEGTGRVSIDGHRRMMWMNRGAASEILKKKAGGRGPG